MEGSVKSNIILVPTDFSEAAATAINHAAEVAKTGQDEILLLHIVNSETKAKLKKEGQTEDALSARLQKQADEISSKYGIKADYLLKEGSIFSDIGEVAEETGARLLVIGTHGVVGVQHITGAYVVKVASTSPVPVIIVQKKGINHHGYKNIVLPVDHTKENKQLAVQASHIAQMFGATVHLFVARSGDEFIQNAINLNLSYVKRLFAENSIPVVETQEDPKGASYGKQLIKYASGANADLIGIMNEKGRSIKEFVVGPENEKIINNDAQIPVMCLNPLDNLFVYSSAIGGFGNKNN